jgi:hypothetical protein
MSIHFGGGGRIGLSIGIGSGYGYAPVEYMPTPVPPMYGQPSAAPYYPGQFNQGMNQGMAGQDAMTANALAFGRGQDASNAFQQELMAMGGDPRTARGLVNRLNNEANMTARTRGGQMATDRLQIMADGSIEVVNNFNQSIEAYAGRLPNFGLPQQQVQPYYGNLGQVQTPGYNSGVWAPPVAPVSLSLTAGNYPRPFVFRPYYHRPYASGLGITFMV